MGCPPKAQKNLSYRRFWRGGAPEILFERKSLSRDSEKSQTEEEDPATTTREKTDVTGRTISFQERFGKEGGGKGILIQDEKVGTISSTQLHRIWTLDEKMGQTYINEELTNTFSARDYKQPQAIFCDDMVRRITPLECERAMGYPDHWTDIGEWIDSKGKRHKDSDAPRYKALGNSIALPYWQWLAQRIVDTYDRPCTMASLFDGIGGFPLVFSRCGCKPVWASEIEEFPIAVTRLRFGEE